MSTLEEVTKEARHDPETKEYGAVVYWHKGVNRYVYFCDHRLKVEYTVKIMPDDRYGDEHDMKTPEEIRDRIKGLEERRIHLTAHSPR